MKLWNSLDDWLWYSVRRRLLDADLETLRDHMNGRVLEIGNGRVGRRGHFQPPAEEAEAWIYLDLENERLPHVQAEVEHLPLEDAVFDTVVCLEVLEYVTRPQAALSEIHRVLKRDGKLILATPFLHRADTPHDYWRFTEHGLRYLLQETGFDVTWLRAQGSALGVAVNILKYAIYAQPAGRRRRWLGCAARPWLSLLWRLDDPTARRHPVLTTFSTGYLAVACVSSGSSITFRTMAQATECFAHPSQ